MAEEKTPTVMAETVEKNEVASSQHVEDVHVVKKVHADGHVDLVDAHAIGGAVENMPEGYFWSVQFIGTVTVRLLSAPSPGQLRSTKIYALLQITLIIVSDWHALIMSHRLYVLEVFALILDGFSLPILCM